MVVHEAKAQTTEQRGTQKLATNHGGLLHGALNSRLGNVGLFLADRSLFIYPHLQLLEILVAEISMLSRAL